MSDLDDGYDGPERPQSNADQDLVSDTTEKFSALQSVRSTAASHCEEIATIMLPQFRNTFFYGTMNPEGQKKSDRQIDSTAQISHSRFIAIADSLLTPRTSFWHGLEANDEALNKDRAVRLYFEEATKVLFNLRYSDKSGFYSANQGVWGAIGAWGDGYMFPEPLFSITGEVGISYAPLHWGQIFKTVNHQGRTDGFIRWFKLTARQCYSMFGWLPPSLRPAWKNRSEVKFDFLHHVYPQYDYDPDRIDAKGKPWASCYVCPSAMALMQDQGGYNCMPLPTASYDRMPGDTYGRSPAMMVLGSMKTLNDLKRIYLRQGHRASEPPLLTPAAGLVSPDLRPGATNVGGMTDQGQSLIGTIPVGDVNAPKEMMEAEKGLIGDAFLTTLFQVLTEHPNMTATQVIQIVNEKGMLVAPTLGRQSDYLGMLVERELDLAAQLGLLPPMPQILKEAKGAYKVKYAGPLFKAMEAGEVEGFLQIMQSVQELVGITQDRSLLHPVNFKVAVPEMMRIRNVRESWMNDPKTVAQLDKQLQQQQQQQAQIQAGPAQAAMQANQIKAQQMQQQQGAGQ